MIFFIFMDYNYLLIYISSTFDTHSINIAYRVFRIKNYGIYAHKNIMNSRVKWHRYT